MPGWGEVRGPSAEMSRLAELRRLSDLLAIAAEATLTVDPADLPAALVRLQLALNAWRVVRYDEQVRL